MTTSAVIWSIGFVAYTFIFNYLHSWVSRRLGESSGRFPLPDERERLTGNLVIFTGLLVDGTLAFGTIASAALAIALDRSEWIGIVSTLYALTLGTFLVLYTNEIRTSLRYVRQLRGRA